MANYGLTEPKDGRLFDSDVKLRRASDFPNLGPLKNHHPLKFCIMGTADLTCLDDAEIGPLKLHYHDFDLPSLDDLTLDIKQAYQAGRNIAAHCVTRAELMLTLAAIEQAGAREGDRIEHAAIADEAAIDWMKRLGVVIVTQPNFITERIEVYRKDVPPQDHAHLWRLKAFKDAGLRLAAGSDAPFGDPNPWAAMAAAVKRPRGFESEAITPEEALALYTKPVHDAGGLPRQIEIGAVADLCLIDRPWQTVRNELSDVKVKATWIGGELVYDGVNQSPA